MSLDQSQNTSSYGFTTDVGCYGYLQITGNRALMYLRTADGQEVTNAFDYPLKLGGFQSPNQAKSVDNEPHTINDDQTYDLIIHYHRMICVKLRGRSISGTVNNVIRYFTCPGLRFARQGNRSYFYEEKSAHSKEVIDEIRAFKNICKNLEEIFDYIEPCPKNVEVFGHKTRELLLVSCTEVENNLRKFLVQNGYEKPKINKKNNNPNMENYPHINEFLHLHKYSVKLKLHPEAGEYTPFSSWIAPNKSLHWYQAYNETKHDRTTSFNKASLNNLINSIAAIHILIISQWGQRIFDLFYEGKYQSCFIETNTPALTIGDLLPPLLIESGNSVMLRYKNAECFKLCQYGRLGSNFSILRSQMP